MTLDIYVEKKGDIIRALCASAKCVEVVRVVI